MSCVIEFDIIDRRYNNVECCLKSPSLKFNGFIDLPSLGDHICLEHLDGSFISYKVLFKVVTFLGNFENVKTNTKFVISKSRRSDLPDYSKESSFMSDFFDKTFKDLSSTSGL